MGRIEEKQATKRKEIALKAIPLIDQYGFQHISIAELCRKLGLSVGSFYHYFHDKNDIIMELFKLIDGYYLNYVERQISEHPNKLFSIKVFCLKYGYYCIACGLEVCRQISLVPLVSFEEKFMSKSRYMNLLISSVIGQGQSLGQISLAYTREQLTDLFLTMIRGYCFDWCKQNGSYDIVGAIEAHCHLLLNQISSDDALCLQALQTAVMADKDFHFHDIT